MFNDYLKYDALGLAELVRKKQVHPGELVEAAIDQIEKTNPQLNAVIYKMYDYAKQQAQQDFSQQPFAGVPFLLKNLELSMQEQPMNFGSAFLNGYIADHDSELTKRYKKAGLIILGRSNAPEFGTDFHTEPQVFGATHNPWQPELTAGGSSGGAAAAVAAGMVPIANAGDGGGSIRVPASCCGVFGLKPSRGRVPLGPDVGKGWQGLIINHAISRSVRDSAAMLDCVAGADIGAAFLAPPQQESFLMACQKPVQNLRIAVINKPLFQAEKVDQECLQATEYAAKLCEALQHHVDIVEPFLDPHRLAYNLSLLVSGETAMLVDELTKLIGRKARNNEIELVNRFLVKLGSCFNAKEFVAATYYFDQVTRQVAKFFQNYDVILTPTLAAPPGKIGSYAPTAVEKMILSIACRLPFKPLMRGLFNKFIQEAYSFSPFTPLFNVSGSPAMSVPLYWTKNNVPIGVQFAADIGQEGLLFSLASQLEEAAPWAQRYSF